MSKVEDIIAASKLSELMNKKEEDNTVRPYSGFWQ